jgi:glycine/sarcosine N-methyltransferase
MEKLPFAGSDLFDAVICTGNSLPHLTDRGAVDGVLAQCAELLCSDGIFVIQALDFSRVRSKKVINLPALSCRDAVSGKAIRLVRTYRLDEHGAAFTPEVTAGGEVKIYRLPMYPLEYDELWRMLTPLGLSNEGTFGDFSGRGYDESCSSYITVARKH